MAKFILRRVAYAILTLYLITTATFFLIAAAPGDPIASKVGTMPAQAQAIIRAKYGLDKNVFERYIIYMKNLLQGYLGESIMYTGKTVNKIIADNAWVSAKISLVALAIELVVGIFLGLVSGLNRGKIADHIIRAGVVLAICVPSFVFAALLQYFIAFKWKLAPIFGWGELRHYILPVLAFVFGGIASYTKYMRSSTLSVLSEDYIITAKAKGCKRDRIIKKHILRNSMIPIVTMTGPAIAGIFAGSFVLEKMFAIPGLGSYYVKSVSENDYTVVLGLTVFYALLYVISLIFVDIAYGLVDPRIRIAKSKD